MAKKVKYLVDTSLVPAALGESVPAHNAAFKAAVEGSKLFSSVYVRMEFIRRWVCQLVKLAAIARQASSVGEFFHYVEQDFATRALKVGFFALGAGENLRQARSPDQLSEEFAHMAIGLLKKFDTVLAARIPNASKCQIGGKTPRVDYDRLLDDLTEFYRDFMRPVTNCEVNAFLRLSASGSHASRIMIDADAAKGKAVIALRGFKDPPITWITCNECAKIGDPIIALEQPPTWVLVHGDRKSYPAICNALGKQQKYVVSAQASQHAQPGWEWRLGSTQPNHAEEQDDDG